MKPTAAQSAAGCPAYKARVGRTLLSVAFDFDRDRGRFPQSAVILRKRSHSQRERLPTKRLP
jgi:hypothetical protein